MALMSQHAHPSCLFKLIFRYLFRRHINFFAIGAVFLSITCLFTVNAVFKGFSEELQQLFRGSLADVLLEWHWNRPSLQEIEDGFGPYAPAPALESFGMVRTNTHVSAVSFKGVDPQKETRLRQAMGMSSIDFSQLEQETVAGSPLGGFLDLLGEGSGETQSPIIIGKVFAERLDLKVGDSLQLVSPNWKEQVAHRNFRIAAIFHSGYFEDDSGKVYIHIDEARNLQQYPGGYSVIQLALSEGQSLSELQSTLEDSYPEARLSTWRDRHGQRIRAMEHERKMIALVLFMIVIVASFGTLAIQWSFVKEKTRDIGILRAMGFSTRSIFTVFLGVSWLVGITGIVLGLISGAALSLNANEVIQLTGWRPFPGDLYYHEKLPVSLQWSDVVWISSLSFSVTTLAGILPAWKATRVDPVEAIAYE